MAKRLVKFVRGMGLEDVLNWIMKSFVTALITVGVHFAGDISISIEKLNDKMAKVIAHSQDQDREFKGVENRLALIEKHLGMRRH